MEKNYFMRWMGFGIFALTVWLFFPFLKSFFVAFLMVMATFPLYNRLEVKISQRKMLKKFAPMLSTLIITLLFSLIVFMPISLFLFRLLSHPDDTIAIVLSFWDKIDAFSQSLPSYLKWLRVPLDTMIPMSETRKDEITSFLAEWLGIGLKTFVLMVGEMLMTVIFFFFLTLYFRRLSLFLIPIIPLARSLKRKFFREMGTMVSIVFYTLVGVMISQGLAFGIFIAFFEGYNALLLGFLTGIASILPLFGTALIWIPIAINEYLQGHIINALIISVYSYIMMAIFIDNVVKLMILNFVNHTVSTKKYRINEFIIFFAILGGLATFGFWGFILGPAIVALAITTLFILRRANRSSLIN